MNNRIVSIVFKIILIVVGAMGAAFCLFAYPFGMSLMTVGNEFYAHVFFCWIVSAPCFLILWELWRISERIRRGRAFSSETAAGLKNCFKLMFFDVIFYFIGIGVFFAVSRDDFWWAYVTVGILGAVVAAILKILEYFVTQGVELKEESEFTV